MKIKQATLSELIPYARNPRKNKAGIDDLAASIKEFGFLQPIVVNSEMVILAGHTRYYAAKKLKLETVPVVVATLNDIKGKAFRIADNKLHEKSSWDDDYLEIEIEELNELGGEEILKLTGFDASEIAHYLHRKLEEENPDDDEPINNYKEQYGVIVVCENEDQQEDIYAKLTEQGYNCKVVVT